MTQRISTISLTVARFALAGWVVAALLFVATSVSEQVSGEIDSRSKDVLAVLRFPWYYGFGFSLVPISLVGFMAYCRGVSDWSKRSKITIALIAAGLIAMVVDYTTIYRPLRDAITPPGQVRTERFVALHKASKHINEVDLTLCFVAAIMMCAPVRQDSTNHDTE